MSRFLPLFFFLLLSVSTVFGQELNCTVSVISPQVQNTEKRIFETLQKDIREFMNSRSWTSNKFTLEERIECSILITVSERISLIGTRQQFRFSPVALRT